jgi:protein-S-isoprenylcysteine O-methyltransferase Ste14
MTLELAGIVFIIAASIISAVFYNHQGMRYRQGKLSRIACLPAFRLVYRWIQFSSILIGCAAFLSHSSFLLIIHHSSTQIYYGLIMGTLGTTLFVWAKIKLGRHYSPCFDSYVPHDLVTSGPYKFIRHPLYTANLITLTGLFVATGSGWMLLNLAALGIYYFDSARREEAELKNVLTGYSEYMQRTWAFLPFLV